MPYYRPQAITTMQDIEHRVKTIVAEQLGIEQSRIANTSSLADDLGADSLDDVELVMAIEDEFAIEIPDSDAEACKTVQAIIDYVAKRTSA